MENNQGEKKLRDETGLTKVDRDSVSQVEFACPAPLVGSWPLCGLRGVIPLAPPKAPLTGSAVFVYSLKTPSYKGFSDCSKEQSFIGVILICQL